MIWERAITDMRLTAGSKGSACHLALLLASILLTGKVVRPTTGDLLGKRSQLDLEPFGLGIPSGVWVWLPLISPLLRVSLKLYKTMDTHLIN